MIANDEIVLAVIGSLIVMLFSIVAFFIKRELSSTDNVKKSHEELNVSISKISLQVSNIDKMHQDMVRFIDDVDKMHKEFNEKFESINIHLHAIDKDSSTTKHELEVISNMIKPLFEIRGEVSRTNKDISSLYQKSDDNKDSIFKLSERINSIEKELITLKR